MLAHIEREITKFQFSPFSAFSNYCPNTNTNTNTTNRYMRTWCLSRHVLLSFSVEQPVFRTSMLGWVSLLKYVKYVKYVSFLPQICGILMALFAGEDLCRRHQDRGVPEDEPTVQGAAAIVTSHFCKIVTQQNVSRLMLREWAYAVHSWQPRLGMHWEIHHPRTLRFPSDNLSGLGVQNPRPWEISLSWGDVLSAV